MRLSATPIDIRQKYMQQALDIMTKTTKMTDLVNQPVQSRILQHIFKNGTKEQKQLIFDQLKDTCIQSLNSKFAKHISVDIILSDYEHFKQQLLPEVFKLTSNAVGNTAITEIFSEIKQSQRDEMLNYTLFKEQTQDPQYYKQFLTKGQLQTQLLIKNIQFLHLCETKMLLGGFLVTDLLLKIFDCIIYLNTINQQQSKELLDSLSFLAGTQIDTFMQLLDGADQTLLMLMIYSMQNAKWKKNLKTNIKGVKKEILQDKNSQRIFIAFSMYTDDTVYAQEMMKVFLDDINLLDIKNTIIQTLYYIHGLNRSIQLKQDDQQEIIPLWKWPDENIKKSLQICDLIGKVYLKKPLEKRISEVNQLINQLFEKQMQKLPIQDNIQLYLNNLQFIKVFSDLIDFEILKILLLSQVDNKYVILDKKYNSQFKGIFKLLDQNQQKEIKQQIEKIQVQEDQKKTIQVILSW